jgi:CRISPR-associated protein Cas5d
MKPRTLMLDVHGDLACFTRPELKVERFSYPVPTPSAVRGIFDSIYCKPGGSQSPAEFRWQVKRIDILAPIKYIPLRRNEVKDKAHVKSTWMTGKEEPEPIWADGTSEMLGTDQRGRTQRQTMALKDVRYRFYAEICPWPGFVNRLSGLEAQFERRARHGKCIFQPYLGCREFPAYFDYAEPGAPPVTPVSISLDIGLMLYDVFDLSRPGCDSDKPCISLFHANVHDGILEVPDYESDDVLKGSRRDR